MEGPFFGNLRCPIRDPIQCQCLYKSTYKWPPRIGIMFGEERKRLFSP